jgi:hypothetical protein
VRRDARDRRDNFRLHDRVCIVSTLSQVIKAKLYSKLSYICL